MSFIFTFLDFLGIKKEIVFSSTLGVNGDRIGRLVNICRHFKADIFYEGASGRNYIQGDEFTEAGISVCYQDYRHPCYSQLYGDFISHLSIIDLLFNHGLKGLDVLTSNQTGAAQEG